MSPPPDLNPRPRKRLLDAAFTGIEELQHFPTEQDRRRAMRHHLFGFNRETFIAGVILSAACIGVYVALLLWLPAILRLLPFALPAWAPFVLRLTGTYAVYFILLRPVLRYVTPRGMRRRLLDCGVPVCFSCGYVLKGLPAQTDRCPECGRALSARVRALINRAPPPDPAPCPDGE